MEMAYGLKWDVKCNVCGAITQDVRVDTRIEWCVMVCLCGHRILFTPQPSVPEAWKRVFRS